MSKFLYSWMRLLRVCLRRNRTIVGLGKFSSGIEDLGANKKHLEGFGN